ncbi:hypothetical protein AB1Y20_016446 [Prymnesium parvum]|uniref:Amino acid permease/ SLC12A domain-containing protein n=1 Tax=Prymnesium parvum TaxID=97485 RepID=A0AB34IDC2_PRYPA
MDAHTLAPLLDASSAPPRKRGLRVCGLVVIGFFWVSGGIYGNEELVSAAPPLVVVSFTALMPLLFSLPSALMTAELATAFPTDGGQVAWVELAFGPSLGAHNAYWLWLTNLFDAAVYPQMAAQYLAAALRPCGVQMGGDTQRLVCWAVVAAVATLNLLGLAWITMSQAVIFVASVGPCLLYILYGLPHLDLSHAAATQGPIDPALLLSWSLWLYSGFSWLGHLAGKVDSPRRTYLGCIAVLLPLVTTLNLLPFLVSLSLDPITAHYAQPAYFNHLAGRLAGPWLQTLFTIGANVSLVGLYHSQMLAADVTLHSFACARLRPRAPPEGRATGGGEAEAGEAGGRAGEGDGEEAWRVEGGGEERGEGEGGGEERGERGARREGAGGKGPSAQGGERRWSWLCLRADRGVPPAAVLLDTACVGALMLTSYQVLVEIEMMLFCLGHLLFLAAFVVLRVQHPGVPRAFKIPGGVAACAALQVIPASVCIATIGINMKEPSKRTWFGAVLLLGLLTHAAVLLMKRHLPLLRRLLSLR